MQAHCTDYGNGTIVVAYGWWQGQDYEDNAGWQKPGQAKYECAYRTFQLQTSMFGQSAEQSVTHTYKEGWTNGILYDETWFQAGNMPGHCPATAAEARAGISWM